MESDLLDLLRRYPRLTLDQVPALLGLEDPPADTDTEITNGGGRGAETDNDTAMPGLLPWLLLFVGFLVTRRRG